MIAKKSNALTEIIYDGHDDPGNLREEVEKIVAGSALEILRIKNACIAYAILRPTAKDETLDDLTVTEVFQRLLDLKGVPEDQQKELLLTYQEAVQDLQEKDAQAD